MKQVTEINWNTERELNLNDDNDLNIYEEDWSVDFTWNGYKLTAILSFSIDFYTHGEGETDLICTDVSDVTINIDRLYLKDEDFQMELKQIINIQNQLATDLTIQY